MASSSSSAVGRATLAILLAAPCVWAKQQVEAVRPFVEGLCSENAASRSAAEKELLAMGPDAIAPLLEILAERREPEAGAIRDILPKYGPGAIRAFERAGYRDYTGQGPRVMWEAAVDAVVRMGDPAVPVILDGFKNPAGELFGFCTRALAVMQERGRRATPLLVPLLDSPRKEVRDTAAALLANFPDPRAYDALVAALKSEDSAVRTYSARGLGYLGDQRAADALLAMVDDPTFAREAAIAALGRIYEPRFRIILGSAARGDKEVSVRNVAAGWLIRSNDPLAMRLGRRYEPIAMSPAREVGILRRYFLMLAVSFVALSVVAFVGVGLGSRLPGGQRWAAVLLAACVLAGFGFAWGGLLPQVTAGVERAILFMVAPAAAAVVYLAALLVRFDLRSLGCLVGFGSFYLGYGVGWLWLWGYFQR